MALPPTQAIGKRNDSVRSLQRGLEVLRAVNLAGSIRAGEVSRLLNLPRPTVYRLLQTLEELGYVRRSASDDRYRVTRRASTLGNGYDAGILICEHAGPVLSELSRKTIWPVDLSIYENASMIVQESTHSRSPLSIDRGMIGSRLPVLRTSAGRAYLSFSPQQEQDIIIRHLRRLNEPQDQIYLDDINLHKMISETHERGYALRDGGEFNPKTSSIAVPVMRESVVLGTISLIWITSALDLRDAVKDFLGLMREAAETLARLSAESV